MPFTLDILLHRAQAGLGGSFSNWETVLKTGYGLEIDIRDSAGEVVICHDVPEKDTFYEPLENLLKVYKATGSSSCLALNVKSCGLSSILKSLLTKYSISNYFCFDMAVPDCLHYERDGLIWYTRVSEYEPYDTEISKMSKGVWLDIFHSTWFDCNDVSSFLQSGKKVCLVASELHKRNTQETLDFVKGLQDQNSLEGLAVCTDFPELYLQDA